MRATEELRTFLRVYDGFALQDCGEVHGWGWMQEALANEGLQCDRGLVCLSLEASEMVEVAWVLGPKSCAALFCC